MSFNVSTTDFSKGFQFTAPSRTQTAPVPAWMGACEPAWMSLINAIDRLKTLPNRSYPKMICYKSEMDPEYIRSKIGMCTRYLESDPQKIHVLLRRGNHYLNLKEYDKALADFNRVLAIEKFHPEAMLGSAKVDYAQCHLSHALVKFKIALASFSLNAEINTHIGLIYQAQNKYELAIQHFEVAVLAFDCDVKTVYYQYYKCLVKLDKLQEAHIFITRLIDHFPNNLSFKMEKADLCVKQNCLTDALSLYLQIQKLNPKNANVYQEIGNIHELLEDYWTAITWFEKGLRLDPKNEKLLFKRAYNTFLSENDEVFEILLKEYKEAHPNAPGLELLSGIEVYFEGSHLNAILCLESFLKIVPDDCLAWKYLGLCHRSNGNYFEALRCFSKAIAINPFDYKSYFERGCIYECQLEYNKAQSDFDFGVRHIDLFDENDDNRNNSESIILFSHSARIHTLQGNAEVAEEIFNKLTDLEEEPYLVDLCFAKHYVYLGKYQEAFEKFESAAELDEWVDGEPILSMINCKRKLGSLEDLERAQRLLSTYQDRIDSTEYQLLKQDVTKRIKELKAKNLPPKVETKPQPKPKKNKRPRKPLDNKERLQPPEHLPTAENDEAVKKQQLENEAKRQEERRLYEQTIAKEKKLQILEKKKLAEIKQSEKEIAIKQREGLLSIHTPLSRSKNAKVDTKTPFQKQKEQWIKLERKELNESKKEQKKTLRSTKPQPIATIAERVLNNVPSQKSAATNVLKPINIDNSRMQNEGNTPQLFPTTEENTLNLVIPQKAQPVVTVAKNVLNVSSQKSAATNVLKPINIDNSRMPNERNVPPLLQLPVETISDPVLRKDPIVLVGDNQHKQLQGVGEAINKIKVLLALTPHNISEKNIAERALLFNLLHVFGRLHITSEENIKNEFLELVNSRLVPYQKIVSIMKELMSVSLLSSMYTLEPMCRELTKIGFFNTIKNMIRFSKWPQECSLFSLDSINLTKEFKISQKNLLYILTQECEILSSMSNVLQNSSYHDGFKMCVANIVRLLSKIEDQELKNEIANMLFLSSLERVKKLPFNLEIAQGICGRIKNTQADLVNLINVHNLTEEL